MKSYKYKGKTESDALETALVDLKLDIKQIYYNCDETKGLFSKGVNITVFTKTDIEAFILEKIKTILELMNIEEVSVEAASNERNLIFKINSNHNALLIGKNGKNLAALQYMLKQIISNNVNHHVPIVLDIENYKEKSQKNIVKLAHRIADDVLLTGEPIAMHDLNSFERRLVHEAVGKSDVVYTESEGIGKDRHIVIKPREK